MCYGFQLYAGACVSVKAWGPRRAVSRSALFFFQAEDGIRDYKVTGVQTCALPICSSAVRTQFLIESIVLSLTGGMIGIILGIVLSLVIPAFLGWPTLVSMMAIVGSDRKSVV